MKQVYLYSKEMSGEHSEFVLSAEHEQLNYISEFVRGPCEVFHVMGKTAEYCPSAIIMLSYSPFLIFCHTSANAFLGRDLLNIRHKPSYYSLHNRLFGPWLADHID